jgi:hypothetical protein
MAFALFKHFLLLQPILNHQVGHLLEVPPVMSDQMTCLT